MKLKRLGLSAVLAFSILAAPLAGEAQQTARVWRIGWLVTGSSTSHGISLTAFREGLQTLGYVEGRNVTLEYRWAEGNVDRLPALAADLVRLEVDVILAGGAFGARAAKNATERIPIVMAGVGEVVESGLVRSLAHPGGNLTGFSVVADPEIVAKGLGLLKEVLPQLKRVAVLWTSKNAYSVLRWRALQRSAPGLGVTLQSHEARSVQEIESALVALQRTHPGALMVLDDPLVFTYRRTIAEFALREKLPSAYGLAEFVTDGGLMSYGANISDTYRRAATYIDKILKGAKPADLPVEQPTKFELVINLKTAKALGLTIPPVVLLRADRMIE